MDREIKLVHEEIEQTVEENITPTGTKLLPGVRELGRGYDVWGTFGNASSLRTAELFDFGVADEEVIPEANSLIYYKPKSVTFTDILDSELTRVSGHSINQYQEELSASVNLEGRYRFFNAAVSLSFDTNRSSTVERMFTTIVDKIIKWKLEMPESIKARRKMLKPEAKTDIDNMDATELFDTYGAYYVSGLLVGGRALYNTVTDMSKYTNSIDVRAAAKASYEDFIRSISVDVSAEYKKAISEFRASSTETIRTLGGNPTLAAQLNREDGFENWSASVNDSPVFSWFTREGLRPIWDLCENDERRKTLIESFEVYAQNKMGKTPAKLYPVYVYTSGQSRCYSTNDFVGAGWKQEFIAFHAYKRQPTDPNVVPIYDFSSNGGNLTRHIYTRQTEVSGWQREGIAFWALPDNSEDDYNVKPVFEFVDRTPNYPIHLYTLDKTVDNNWSLYDQPFYAYQSES